MNRRRRNPVIEIVRPILAVAVAVFGSAQTMMLLAGIAHLEWWALVPPMSYQAALQLVLMSMITSGLTVGVVRLLMRD